MTHTLFIIQMYKNQKENSITLLVLIQNLSVAVVRL